MNAASSSPAVRDREAAAILALLDAPGYGPRKVLDLLARFGSADDVIREALSSSSTPDRIRDHLERVDVAEYMSLIGRTQAAGGDYKLWSDGSYPANLSKWASRPPVLFYRGDLDELSTRALALVGRVDPTDRGVDAAARFARLCVDNEIDVVSGLAKGIDGASHRAALTDPPGRTYAVIGHGLDYAYPSENSDLYESIPHNGAVVSQFSLGVGPQRWTFPARNEVMCTLALGTVIIEGKEGCGSIIQADFSFKHGRPVFLLSRNLRTDNSEWAHKLVNRGAHVIETFEQVMKIVESSMGDLWGERPTQATFFEVAPDGRIVTSDEPNDRTPMPEAALFDIDGVIVDSRAAHAAAIAAIATRHLGRQVDPSAVNVTGAAHKALAALGVPNAYDVYRDEYDREFQANADLIVLFDAMVSGIQTLKDRGVRIGAVTGQPKRRADVMLPPNVRALFDVFYCYNDTKGAKEVGISKALQTFSISADHAVFIGDQATDLKAAQVAGVKSAAVLWGFSTHDDLRKWNPDTYLHEPAEAAEQVLELLQVS